MPFSEPTGVTIDGVPVWFTDVPGPCLGGIVFRSGKADETLHVSGINHVVEHLALAPLMYRGFDMNGYVNALTTVFYTSGTQDQVESFISELCDHLREPRLDRLDLERDVLETEARSGGGTYAGSASARFGARGFGITDWPEFGLRWLGPDEVGSWAAERFTASQAAVWLTRPPTPALTLRLAEGSRLPVPTPEPLPYLQVPGHIHGMEHLLACSFSARRSMPMLIAMRLLQERAMATLRGEHGLTYTVGRQDERVGANDSMYWITCDATESAMPRAVTAFVGLMEAVAEGDVSLDEVRGAHRASMPWNATDPARPAQEAFRKATASLFGREPTPWKGLEAQGERLTVERVADAMAEALGDAILVAPEGLSVPNRFARHPDPPPRIRTLGGRLYVRWDGDPYDQILYSIRGVTRITPSWDKALLFDEVEVALLGPDGTIWLIDRFGDGLPLEPNQLRHGRELVSTLMERLAEKVVDMRRDVMGWFELQSHVDSHDTSVIRSMWREIEIVARARKEHERILVLAFGDLEGRGVVAVTDERLVQVVADRVPPLKEIPREKIISVQTTFGFRGARLRIRVRTGHVTWIDRIRPRTHAGELELQLSPIEDPIEE